MTDIAGARGLCYTSQQISETSKGRRPEVKITNAHTHIFPHSISVKAAASIGHFYDDMVVMWGDGSIEMLKENCAECGISRCLTHSVATTAAQVKKINDFIAASVAESGGLLVGFATMHPDFEDMAGELDRALEMGLVGVKLHPDMQRFAIDDKRAMRLYELMCERRMPLVAHTGDTRYDFSNPDRTANVCRAFPEMKIQAAHFGGYSCWEEAMEKLEGLGLYTDTSSSFFAIGDELAMKLIRFYGADHVMFGSDYPMWNAADELERLSSLPLTEEERRFILNDSADRFLDPAVR